LDKLYREIPDLAISTDIMVGFPGEDEEKFQRSLEFVRQGSFSRLHVFRYSPRRGTPAAEMAPQVEAREKEKRSKKMIQLGKELTRAFQETFLGRTIPVLLEEEDPRLPGFWEGHTSNYLRVRVKMGAGDWKGKVVYPRLRENRGDYLKGELQP
jgi:threonylcarbamoyladenosine tRNA methylthiotransferase MtaB